MNIVGGDSCDRREKSTPAILAHAGWPCKCSKGLDRGAAKPEKKGESERVREGGRLIEREREIQRDRAEREREINTRDTKEESVMSSIGPRCRSARAHIRTHTLSHTLTPTQTFCHVSWLYTGYPISISFP
eukprot:Tamp_24894.p3 GENE.Tamp_24894~~Tamp_24894.p3  ORF type:complete len:131 (+),score=1.08 Tamp_24894:509-901(+)